MDNAEVAAYIGRWRPVSVPAEAAAFARLVTGRAGPGTRKRANALLHASARLAGFAASLGLELVPEVVLHPSVIERFALAAPGVSAAARRTLRTNQRFIARRVVPELFPPDVPLPRERSKAPYSEAEIAGYLALADAQPTAERRMRAAGRQLQVVGGGGFSILGKLSERWIPESGVQAVDALAQRCRDHLYRDLGPARLCRFSIGSREVHLLRECVPSWVAQP